ncbi:MAG: potassium-transporting ATPase subunit KdpC [Myxococcota bacterium]
MTSLLRPTLVLFGALTFLTGIVYPLVVTGLAQTLLSGPASGSLIRDGDRVVGSTLIGQTFSDPRFFWSRPSATAPVSYNAAASTGSNLGPSNPVLHEAVRERIAALREAGAPPGPVPVDLVTASGSGLDPHISPAAAIHQASRVARARGLAEETVRRLIDARIEGRSLGVLGEPRVNVLLLNLDLERAAVETGP